jgi:hypothetical protein
MNKFLKKNYKKILIVCLILLLFSSKMYENFTTAQALDAVISTQNKVNGIVHHVSDQWVDIKKKLSLKNELYVDKKTELKADVHIGGNLFGKKDIKGPKINISANGTVYANRLNLGGKEIGADQLAMLLDGFYFKAIGGSAHHQNSWIHNHGDGRIGPTGCGGHHNKDCATLYRMSRHT